jgi:hypothetical protein
MSGLGGAKGGRARDGRAITLSAHVRQLRREALQHSLQTNWRHSWQKRKLWTKAWYASSSILASNWRRALSNPSPTLSCILNARFNPIETAWSLPVTPRLRREGGSTNRVLQRSHEY